MTAEVQRPIAFSVAETAASASCQCEALACVSQFVNFQALSSSVLNRCRLFSCDAPASATLQMWSAQAFRSAFFGGSWSEVHGNAVCAALLKASNASRHRTPID